MTVEPDTTVRDASPQHPFQLRSYLGLSPSIEPNGAAYYVDAIAPQLGAARVRVPSYARLDPGLIRRASHTVQLGLWGQNLLEDSHAEFGNFNITSFTEVPRSVVAKVTWSR